MTDAFRAGVFLFSEIVRYSMCEICNIVKLYRAVVVTLVYVADPLPAIIYARTRNIGVEIPKLP